LKKLILLLVVLLLSNQAQAAYDNCIGAYVGRISIHHQSGLDKVVLMAHPDNSSGSYWVFFTGWNEDAKKQALAVLMAAKASQHKVDLITSAENGCNIGQPGQVMREVHLSTNR
jgi:hypothetical protein